MNGYKKMMNEIVKLPLSRVVVRTNVIDHNSHVVRCFSTVPAALAEGYILVMNVLPALLPGRVTYKKSLAVSVDPVTI